MGEPRSRTRSRRRGGRRTRACAPCRARASAARHATPRARPPRPTSAAGRTTRPDARVPRCGDGSDPAAARVRRATNRLGLERVLRGDDAVDTASVLRDRGHEPMPLVEPAEELALLAAVTHEQEQTAVVAVCVGDADGLPIAGNTQREESGRQYPPSAHPDLIVGGRRSGRNRARQRDLELCHARPMRTMLSKPLAHPSTLDRRNRAAQADGSAVRRGGALEPGALVTAEKSQAKVKALSQLRFSVPKHRGTFLSRAGPHSRLALVQAEHLPLVRS